MSNVMLSVIIPMHNSERFISDCLTSIALQGISDKLEIILVDDFSLDKSVMIAQQCCKEYELTNTIIKMDCNKGVSTSRNVGLEYIKGEYITFLDSDDVFHENSLLKVLKVIEATHADIVYGGYNITDENMILLGDFTYNYYAGNGVEIAKHFAMCEMWLCIGCLFIKNEIITENQIRFQTLSRYGEDTEFFFKCLFHSNTVEPIRSMVLNYRQHAASAMAKSDFSRFDSVESMKGILEYVKLKLPEQKQLTIAIEKFLIPKAVIDDIRALASSGKNSRDIKNYIRKKEYDQWLRIKNNKLLTPKIRYQIFAWNKIPNVYCLLFRLRSIMKNIKKRF